MKYKLVIWDMDAETNGEPAVFELPEKGPMQDRNAVILAGERWVLNYPHDIVMLVGVSE